MEPNHSLQAGFSNQRLQIRNYDRVYEVFSCPRCENHVGGWGRYFTFESRNSGQVEEMCGLHLDEAVKCKEVESQVACIQGISKVRGERENRLDALREMRASDTSQVNHLSKLNYHHWNLDLVDLEKSLRWWIMLFSQPQIGGLSREKINEQKQSAEACRAISRISQVGEETVFRRDSSSFVFIGRSGSIGIPWDASAIGLTRRTASCRIGSAGI